MKLKIDGEVLEKEYPLRTTVGIYNFYLLRAGDKNTSVNAIMNIALLKYKNEVTRKQKSFKIPLIKKQ